MTSLGEIIKTTNTIFYLVIIDFSHKKDRMKFIYDIIIIIFCNIMFSALILFNLYFVHICKKKFIF